MGILDEKKINRVIFCPKKKKKKRVT